MLANLVREVAESRSVTESAIAFIKGLQEKIASLAAGGLNEEALKAEIERLAAELDMQQANLAAALVTGTVADASQPAADNGVEAAPNHEPAVPPAPDVAAAAAETEAATDSGSDTVGAPTPNV